MATRISSACPTTWILTAPDGTVREVFSPKVAERARALGWRVETAGEYLGRINAAIKRGAL